MHCLLSSACFLLGLLKNAIRQQDGHHSKKFDETKDDMSITVLHTDTTFNLTVQGWCHASVSARNSRRVRGSMVGQGMPIVYLLSRTENGSNVADMFKDTRAFLGTFEDFHFRWNVVISDHHDGVVNAVRSIEQGNQLSLLFYC